MTRLSRHCVLTNHAKPFRTCIEVVVRIITTYGFNGALDAIQVQVLLMGIEPAMGITLCSLPVFLRLVSQSRRACVMSPRIQLANHVFDGAVPQRQESFQRPQLRLRRPGQLLFSRARQCEAINTGSRWSVAGLDRWKAEARARANRNHSTFVPKRIQ